MTREDAIRRIKAWNLDSDDMEVLAVVIPELAESEDERIRKEIVGVIQKHYPNTPESYKWIAYLEKQKELFKSGRGLYYYDGEKTVYMGYPATEENPYDFAMNQQEEKQKVNTEGDFGRGYDCGYQAGYSVAMNEMKPKVATATLDSEKQKEHTPAEPELKIPDWVHGSWDDEYMINTVIGRYSLHAEVAKKRGDTHDYNLSKSMENWLRNVVKPLILEKQKEQIDNANKEYWRGYREGKQEILDKFADSKKLKEQKPVQSDTEKEYVHTLKSIIFDFLRGKQEVDRDYYQQIEDWLDGRHVERKPVKCIEFDNEFEYQVSNLLVSVLNGEHEYNEGFVKYASQSLLGYAKKEQKPAEWGEEDEIYLQDALWCVKQAAKVARGENDMGACWSAERWLKSLRPPFKDREMKLKILKYLSTRCSSLEFEEVEDYLNNLRPLWKPSEEQMNALLYAMSFVSPATKESVLLSEIYENLKKCNQ